jgi:uncharacterized membrane protein YcaP (DUF421 family)
MFYLNIIMPFPAEIILRSVVVYLFILAAIRLFGKKEFSQLTIIDLVFILLISNSVQNAMVGSDSSLWGGLIAAGSLFLTNYILKFVMYRFRFMDRFFQGEPIILVHEGNILEKNLKKERISMEELELSAREHGVASIKDVNLAILEVDGNITFLSDSYHKHSRNKRRAHKSMGTM